MTIAVDKTSGNVLGQVVDCLPWAIRIDSLTRILYLCATGYHSAHPSTVRLEVVR